MADDGEAMMAQFEAAQQRLQALDARMGRLDQAARELRSARETLTAMEGAEGEQETLVPIGGGVHLRARVDPSQLVVAPLGRGYAADRGLEAAKAAIQERLDETTQALEADNQEAQQLAQSAQQLAQQLQSRS